MNSALDSLALAPAAGVETALAQPLTFSVPVLDNDEFSLLPVKRREEVNVMLRFLERVHALRNEPKFVDAVKTLAAAYRHRRGCSPSSVLRKYYAYIKRGNWRVLVNDYKGPNRQPGEFIEFVRGLIEQNPRSAEAAIEQLREEIWPSGAEVPGYGTWQEFFAKAYPHQPVPARFPRVWPEGWTVRNLRRYGPTRAEKNMAQGGLGAAHAFLPKIVRDTSRLRPMELIVIDDFQLDVMNKFSGNPESGLKPQIAYVGGLMAMCVGNRKHLAKLFGPMVEREEKQADGTIKKVRSYVRQIDVQALLYTIFREHGMPRDYDVTILCENKTATITPAMELMLMTVFGGRIRVRRTSLIEHKTLTNGFVETGGTPWEKGWIESDFNYLWNQLARLPGYKGSNERLNAPGDLAAKLKYAAKFLGQGKGELNLPPEIIEELPLPFMSEQELELAFDFVIERAEQRTKHRFLGFDMVTEFRWPNPALPAPAGIDPVAPNSFRSLALLKPEQQAIMIPEERKESTIERWERLSAEHPRVAVSTAALAMFLLTPNKAHWRNHAVTFTRNKQGYSYVDDEGVMKEIAEGTELLAYVDFNSPGAAVICGLDGARIGVLRMLSGSTRGVDITDPQAVAEARARRAAIVNRVLATVRTRPVHQATNAKLAADKAHAEEIVAAWQKETAQLPVADQLGATVGELQQREQEQRKRAAKAARGVPAQSGSKGLADLVQGEDTATPAPAPAPTETPESGDEAIGLDDL